MLSDLLTDFLGFARLILSGLTSWPLGENSSFGSFIVAVSVFSVVVSLIFGRITGAGVSIFSMRPSSDQVKNIKSSSNYPLTITSPDRMLPQKTDRLLSQKD